MLMGAGCLSGGFVSASFASQTRHLYPSQGALVGLGMGFIHCSTVAMVDVVEGLQMESELQARESAASLSHS
jgi:hypothetical protein